MDVSKILISRVESYMDSTFSSLVNVDNINPKDKRHVFLSRCTAAIALMSLFNIDASEAANCLTDGRDDGGVDAIYFSQHLNQLIVVQAKWSDKGTKTIDVAAIHKTIAGLERLLNNDFTKFNDTIRKRQDKLSDILLKGTASIVIVIAYNSAEDIHQDVLDPLEKYMAQVNKIAPVLTYETVKFDGLYSVAMGSQLIPQKDTLVVRNWQLVSEGDRRLLIGITCANDLATLYEKYHDKLFEANIRGYLENDPSINNTILNGLKKDPAKFLYFNNGITIAVSNFAKSSLGGSSSDIGIFECENINIVNGAQTVGVCYQAQKDGKTPLDNAFVLTKIIEVKDDLNFLKKITITANTQNKVEKANFVALDGIQYQLQEELSALGVSYFFKPGTSSTNEADIDVNTATLALAAITKDLSIIATAKREIGSLLDVNGKSYAKIFNKNVNGYTVLNAVGLYREIQEQIKRLINVNGNHTNQAGVVDPKRKEAYAIHGNVFFAYKAISSIDIGNISTGKFNLPSAIEQLSVAKTFDDSIQKGEQMYKNAYLVYLFRNAAKLKDIE